MPLPQYAGASDYQRPSLTLWRDCPGLDRADFSLIGDGSWISDDFTQGIITGKQVATAATAGTFAMGDAANGVAIADSGSTTVTQGIQVQWGTSTTGEIFKAAANKKIWVEGRMRFTASGTGPEFFWGLAVQDTSIIATSALSAQAIGYKSVTDNNVLLGTCKDGSSETTASSIHTMVDSTWTKLGFKVTGTGLVEFYVDGVKKANTIIANIPTTELKLSLVCQTSGTTQPTVELDWIRAFGQR